VNHKFFNHIILAITFLFISSQNTNLIQEMKSNLDKKSTPNFTKLIKQEHFFTEIEDVPNSPAPIGGQLTITDDDLDQTKPAVAYSTTSGDYLVAWMDHNPTYPAEPERGQIFVRFVYANGTMSNTDYFYDGVYNSAPDIAYDSIHDRFLIVWENHCLDRDYWDISAFQISASTGQWVGDITSIFRGEDYHFRHPSITFNSDSGEFLVAAEIHGKNWAPADDWDIYARRVIPNDNGALTAVGYSMNNKGIPLATSANKEISSDVAYDDMANVYLVAWEYENGLDKIQGRIVKPDGTLPGQIVDIAYSNFNNVENPKLAFNPDPVLAQFLLVYEESGSFVVGQRIYSSYPNPDNSQDPFDIDTAVTGSTNTKPNTVFSQSCNCFIVTYDSEKNFLYKIFAQQVYGTNNDDGQLDGDPLKIAESQWGLNYGGTIRRNANACDPSNRNCLTVWEFGDAERDVVDVLGQRMQCSNSGNESIFLPMVVK